MARNMGKQWLFCNVSTSTSQPWRRPITMALARRSSVLTLWSTGLGLALLQAGRNLEVPACSLQQLRTGYDIRDGHFLVENWVIFIHPTQQKQGIRKGAQPPAEKLRS